MFDWFGKRKRAEAAEAPAAAARPLPAPAARPPESASAIGERALRQAAAAAPAPALQRQDESAQTVAAPLWESAHTIPASLEAIEREERATAEAPEHSCLSWLLGVADPLPDTALASSEEQLLRRIDQQLAAATLPPDLLPRAPAVVPQLMGLLRREEPPRAEMARQVAKDVLLTTEVLRIARSAAHGLRPVDRLEDALDRIGQTGLKQAMVRVLVRPVFQAPSGGLSARAAPRLWLYSEAKSELCPLLAEPDGDRFEAFLAGLMHDTGWVALLRLLDRNGTALPPPFTSALDDELARRKEQLFGRLTADWGLTPGLTRLAQALAAGDAAAEADPLALLLRKADRLCLNSLSGGGAAAQ